MAAPIPASWVLVPCQECNAEGYIEAEEAGGYFDMRQECWYPKTQIMRCPLCHGEGMIEVTFEAHLAELKEAA